MKVFLDSVGCRLNQAEIRQFAWQFMRAGYELSFDRNDADLILINSCSVTTAAAADSRSLIRRAQRNNPDARVVVTGCWNTMEPVKALELCGQNNVFPNTLKDTLTSKLLSELPVNEPEILQPITLHDPRRTRAFIKVQDGCDHRCAYCVTTIARGFSHSSPITSILQQIQREIENGAMEIVLTGVQLSAFGKDLNPKSDLSILIRIILESTRVLRLRLSSLEPWDLPDDLLSLWQSDRMCRQLHLPLQSGSPATLKRMKRPVSPRAYADFVKNARHQIPGIAITTDLITGFPGETETEFAETCAFVERMQFARAHIFSYSPRPGTAAISLPDQVPLPIARQRNANLRTITNNATSSFQHQFCGASLNILWEKSDRQTDGSWALQGWSDNYLRVHASAPADRHNRIDRVRILRIEDDILQGCI